MTSSQSAIPLSPPQPPSNETLLALFSANLKLLHRDDSNLLDYFGLDRSQLVEHLKQALSGEANSPLRTRTPALQGELEKLLSISLHPGCPSSTSPFFWFEYRCYLYFRQAFLRHPSQPHRMAHLNLRPLLGSVKPYIMNTVRRMSEAVLTHALNLRIQQKTLSSLAEFSAALKERLTIAAIAATYPVLFDLLIQTLLDINTYVVNVIQHFIDDHRLLCTTFASDTGKINQITLGLGDPHGNYQTVCEVKTTHQALIYKPRANREAAFYQETLLLLHNLTLSDWFSVYVPKSLTQADHCWTEKVLHLPCQTATQHTLFYQRLGAQVAVVHALNGIDFHFENIIAHGTSPVMIDLECLFNAPLGNTPHATPPQPTLAAALQTVRDSVFSSGFVPFAQHAGNDVSGLTPQCRFSILQNTLIHENGFYHLRKISTEHDTAGTHQPFEPGSKLTAQHYLPALLEGFEFGYHAISQHKQRLVDHLRHSTKQLTTRLLVKNTQRYVDFIALGLHPRFMQNWLDRELLFATLWSEAKGNPLKEHALKAEIGELQRLNIPRFTLMVNSDSFNPGDNQGAPLMLDDTPIQACRRKMLGFSPANKALQLAVLQKCLAPTKVGNLPLNAAHVSQPCVVLTSNAALRGARAVAQRLIQLKIEADDGGIRWLAFKTHHSTQKHYLTAMNNDLYAGMAGIGLFFLGLYRVTGELNHLHTTDQIITSIAQTQRHFDGNTDLSAFQGLGGYLYLIWHRKTLAPTQAYDAQIAELTASLCTPPTDTCDSDFIAGSCGILSLLAALHLHAPQGSLALAIKRRAQHIYRSLQLAQNGTLHNRDGSPALSGLAHGISGAVLALCKAYQATQDEQLIPWVKQFVHAENALKQDGFWLDLRECRTSQSMSKWCHGDAGILLARQAVVSSMGEQLPKAFIREVQADIECCLSNLYCHGLGSGYGLCHGDFGNLMCLQSFYRTRGDTIVLGETQELLGAATRDFLDNPAIANDSYPELGLMTGIAGIGYCLLKQLDPSLPDVLSLELTASNARF
ncbi:hypothetical protein DBADOPDK_04481 [Pseudomonas sp. MM223]|nr:hypothetical protein DBADOPDK_04481 [Pseudomonas sp. MM223]